MPFDGEAFGLAVVDAVKAAIAPLQARIAELETRKSVAGVHISREGALVATYSDGTTRDLGPVVGKDGERGTDGAAGFDLSSFDVQLADDGRTLEFVFEDAERKAAASLTLPTMIYRGIWADGAFQKGDTVTYQGSLFVALANTSAKPGTADWQLAAKRGRDGKGV